MNKPRKQPRANPAFAGLGPLKEKCPTPQGDYPRTNPEGSPLKARRPSGVWRREKSPSAGGRQAKISASVAAALAVAPAMREHARRAREDA